MEGYDTPCEVIMKLFHEIIEVEEKVIITEEFRDISNNDMHIIEVIGLGEPRSMSSVARDLSVTVGTLTTAINGLVKKDYVRRGRSEKDRRVVLISLKEKGVKAFHHHKRFHEEMIGATLKGLDQEQIQVLETAMKNLREFFRNYGKQTKDSGDSQG